MFNRKKKEEKLNNHQKLRTMQLVCSCLRYESGKVPVVDVGTVTCVGLFGQGIASVRFSAKSTV